MNFKYIHINSINRILTSVSPTDFSIKLDQALFIYKIQLDTVQIPYTYYNVQTTNNKLVINWNSANHTLTVPAGNYTSSQLLTELNSLISAVNSNLSVTYDSNTWTFSFVFSSASPNTGSLILSQSTINR